jgi:murein DD-endopeptidase MepM/ murein hydrolase activator NlpD
MNGRFGNGSSVRVVRRLGVTALVAFGVLVIPVRGDTSMAIGRPRQTSEPPSPCVLAPVAAPVRDPFRAPGCRWCPGNRGIEYATAPGSTVRAGAGGVVTFSGLVAGVRYVVVEHRSGLRTTYGALASAAVGRGAWVQAGAPVGTSTDTMHFGVRRGETYLDPAAYLVRRHYRPRLVPLNGPRRPAVSVLTCAAREGAGRGGGR